MRSRRLAATALALGLAVCTIAPAARRVGAQQIPQGWTAERMTAIGYSDLDGRGGAFKLAIREVKGRWYLYMGHLWHRGWSIVDVTDPAAPKLAKFVPWPQENTWTIQMELHDNIMVTALQRAQTGWGGDPQKPFDEGVVFWDISDPINPRQVSHWKTGGTGTHRNWYAGGKYAHLAAGMPGYQGQIYVILDISDPKNPKEAGRWWMPGQHVAGGETPTKPASFHGPAYVEGNTAYLGYGPSVVILDISDVSKPRLVGELPFVPPFKPGGSTSVHGVMTVPGKPVLIANSEAGNEKCDEALNHTSVVDISDPSKPRLMALFPLPVPPAGAPFTDFCDKGGRFGPHNLNQEQHLPDVEEQGDLVYLTYFNAGLRIYDISRPRVPREVAWFVPPTPTRRIGPIPTSALETQVEDVLVDRRGNIYITDKQWGLWVLRHEKGTGSR
ncbi:MAG: hypothetical protein HYU53_03940 [Acidobacteria bacterium]|nr:hypothetical protein [Acidobacteriota bacterium]